MSSFLGNEKYASEDTVNKYLTDKADSMLTRMQSLGSYLFCLQTVITVYCIIFIFIKLTLSAKDINMKHSIENFVLWWGQS